MPKYGTKAILPYPAEVPIKETLEFLTDVIQAYDSTEQRLNLRKYARQTFDYIIPLNPNTFAEAFNTQYGALRSKNWLVPFWSEAQYVGTVSSGATSVTCVTSIYGFKSFALLINSCGDYRVLEISSIESTRIVLGVNVSSTINNAYLLPVGRGWIQGDIEMPTNGYSSKQTISYVLDESVLLVPDPPPNTYFGIDMYYDVPYLTNGTIQTSLSQHQEIVDMQLGVISKFSHWATPQYSKPWRFIMTTPQEVYEFRKFFYRRIGKFREFYFPSFDSNMRVTSTGSITTTLIVRIDSYIDYASIRDHIAIEAGGVWYHRTISGVTPLDSTTMQFTLSTSLGGIPASSIIRVSFMGLYRLDTDRAEIIHKNGVVEASLQVLELKP